MGRLLALNVLFDDFQWSTAYGGHKIGVGPEGWQLRAEFFELLAEYPGRMSFDLLDSLMDAKLWVYFQEQMHMIRHEFHFDDFHVHGGARFLNEFF